MQSSDRTTLNFVAMNQKIKCNIFQRSLYYEWLRNPISDAYHLPFNFRLVGEIKLSKLIEALNYSLNYFPSLRFRYVEDSDILVDLMDPILKSEVLKLSMEPFEFHEWITKEARQFFSRTFDLNKGENVFAKIIQNVNTKEVYVWILCHHISSDIFSFHQFFTNTFAEYYNKGRETLDDEDFKYRLDNYINLNLKCMDLQSGEDFWSKSALKDIKRLNSFPNKLLEGCEPSFFTDFFVLDSCVHKSISEYCKFLKISTFNFFLSSYCILIASLTKNKEVVIGLPITLRSTKEEKRIFGYFVNTLPVYINLRMYKSALEIYPELSTQVFSLLRNKFITTNSLLLKNAQSPLQMGLIDNSFTFYDKPLSFSLNDCNVVPIELTHQYPQFKFSITIEDLNTSFRVRFHSILFSSSTIEERFRSILQGMLHNKVEI